MAWPAWAVEFGERVRPLVEPLAIWRGYEAELETLAIYGLGIAVYTALVFAFYNSVSRRRPLKFDTSERKDWAGHMSRFVEGGLILPIMSFLYFSVLAVALFVLAKAQSVQQILLIAMAVIVGVRVTVYLSEQMSNDLAKLVPLSLLAVVLVDPGYLTLEAAWDRMVEAVGLWPLLARYFLVFIALEVIMTVARASLVRFAGRWEVLRIPPRKKTTFGVEVKPGAAKAPPPEPKVR